MSRATFPSLATSIASPVLTASLPFPPLSPEAITALQEERASGGGPLSPRPHRRRSSTGPVSPALRPVIIERDEDGRAAEGVVMDGGELEVDGPAPVEPHSGPAVDEFEAIFGL